MRFAAPTYQLEHEGALGNVVRSAEQVIVEWHEPASDQAPRLRVMAGAKTQADVGRAIAWAKQLAEGVR